MKRSELPLFIGLMSLYFIAAILLIFKPTFLFNLYKGFLKLWGFKLEATEKGFTTLRVLGTVLLFFGGFILYKVFE